MLAREIFRNIYLLEKPITDKLDQVLESYGLTLSQWKIIDYLTKGPPSTLVKISKYLSIEKPSVTRTVARLEEKRLVEQVSGLDNREKRIQLTTNGQKLHTNCRSALDEIEAQLLQGVSPDAQNLVHQALLKIHTNLSEGGRQSNAYSKTLD